MKFYIKILLIPTLFLINGCLKNNDNPIVNFELDNNARILRFLEGQGDYINSYQPPSLISVDEVYYNLNQIVLLDIRSADDYSTGHILNSVNVKPENLFEITDSLYRLSSSKKIVIVSKNGQASAYFVALLRLAGFNTTFSLKYGMAYWNNFFADEWLAALCTDDVINTYSNFLFNKLPMSAIPKLSIPATIKDDREMTLYRIKEVIKAGFKQDVNYSREFDYAVKNTHIKICYGPPALYYMSQLEGGFGHAQETIWFQDNPVFDFRSTNYLQTLPPHNPVIIYSGDGQLGAAVTAYLTVLGYNVKTLLFGANQLFYFRMPSDPNLTDSAFKPEEIRNYPYVTGN